MSKDAKNSRKLNTWHKTRRTNLPVRLALGVVQINDFVEVNFNIKGKVGEKDRLYNNLVGISIKKI